MKQFKGVNLGGWLVLENWMTTSLFKGLKANDETSLCVELKEKATELLHNHWATFITEYDFKWIADAGLDSVRIPVGHWILDEEYPYNDAYCGIKYPYVKGGLKYLDLAFKWAAKYKLTVTIDLHAAPGCQNGFDNGGISGVCEWRTKQEYINYSLYVIEELAKRYADRKELFAIEILNEPARDTPTELLVEFTTNAYKIIRKYCKPEDVTVIFHDGFRCHPEFVGVYPTSQFQNIMLDLHRYQCFIDIDKERDIYSHLEFTVTGWKQEADQIINEMKIPTVIGEWSVGYSDSEKFWEENRFQHQDNAVDPNIRNLMHRAYAAAQLLTFEKYQGWYFWSYKTEKRPAWSYRHCVENGWIPRFKRSE
jgi:glucan 1,3-beta-glucosidase